MIDIRELRRDPGALAKLARKGAGELGQELLDLDELGTISISPSLTDGSMRWPRWSMCSRA